MTEAAATAGVEHPIEASVYFRIHRSPPDLPTWRLHEDDHEVIAWAGRCFVDVADAQRACETFRAAAHQAGYEIHLAAGGGWSWRAWHGRAAIACSPRSFAGRAAAERAAAIVLQNAGSAFGP